MSRSTSKEIASYLQWRVREWVRSGKTARELAKLAGVSTAQISELQNAGIGAGWKTAEGLAKAFGMSMMELMAAAQEWAEQQPVRADAGLPVDMQRRRALAAELAREDDVSEAAIRSVLEESTESTDAQRSTVWWILRMKRRDVELVDSAARHQSPPEERPVRAERHRR